MLLNGSGVAQPAGAPWVGGGAATGVTLPGAGSMPGGYHPPLKQVPPPSATNGSEVWQPP